MMKWYLITHNLHALQVVTARMAIMEVEYFAPTKTKVTRRSDCEGVRTTQTILFPGYLFVRLDPEVVHPSTVADIPGVKEFVRFGGEICTISGSLIEAWRQGLMLRPNKNVTQIEYRNVSPALLSALEYVTSLKCKLARQSALFEVLQNHVGKDSYENVNQLVVSVLEHPVVDERIN